MSVFDYRYILIETVEFRSSGYAYLRYTVAGQHRKYRWCERACQYL